MTTDKTEETAVAANEAPVQTEMTTEHPSQQRIEQPVYPTPRTDGVDPSVGDVAERMNADLAKGYIGIRPGD